MSLPDLQITENADGNSGAALPNGIKEAQNGQAHQGAATQQYITFRVNEEEYGIDIMSVLEIKGWTETTRLPNQPDYLRGVLYLRGVIVPIIDLRYRFGGGQTEALSTNVVIIVSIEGRYMGILVDAVSDILTVSKEDIQDVPSIDVASRDQFLSGLVTINDRMVAILELHKLKDDADEISQKMDLEG